MAIAGAVTLLDLDLVVIGGGVAAGRPAAVRAARGRLYPLCRIGFRAAPRVVPALLGGAAGLIGAAAVVLVPGRLLAVCSAASGAWTGSVQLPRPRRALAGCTAWSRSASRRSGPPRSCCAASPGTRRWNRPGRWPHAVGGPVFLKCENLQRTGSFKIRGAYVRIARLTEAGEGRRGGRRVGRQPRPGRGAGRVAGRLHGEGVHARRRVHRQADRHPRLRRDVDLVGESLDDALEAAHGVRRPHRCGAGAPVRPSGRAARAGHRRPGDPGAGARTWPPWWSRPVVAG